MWKQIQSVVLGVLITAMASATVWGVKALIAVQPLAKDVEDLKSFKNTVLEKIGNIDGKLDAMMSAQGIEYKPRRP